MKFKNKKNGEYITVFNRALTAEDSISIKVSKNGLYVK